MALLAIPPELKKITQFIRRAEELDRDRGNPQSRVVAYYCRQYAVQIGLPVAGSSASAKECLGEILGQLEAEQKAMSAFSGIESKLVCRTFADNVFERANMQDVTGVADKDTAKSFYASATFYEILQQFPVEISDNEDDFYNATEKLKEDKKRRYSKWKATEILKALKEGSKSASGGYREKLVEDDSENEGVARDFTLSEVSAPPKTFHTEEFTDEEGTEVGLVTSAPRPPYSSVRSLGHSKRKKDNDSSDNYICIPHANKEEHKSLVGVECPPVVRACQPPPPPARSPHPTPPPARSIVKETKGSSVFGFKKKVPGGTSKVSKEAFANATELTKFALKALESKEADLATERLQQALKALRR